MTLSADEYADTNDSELLRLIKASDWDGVTAMIETETGKAMTTQPDIYGNLPLHACLGYKAPDDIVLSILRCNPDATRVHGTDYWLPLHICAMWGSSTRVMSEIIGYYPQALDDVGEPGIKGRTPRHFAPRFKHNTELLERSTEDWIRIIAES